MLLYPIVGDCRVGDTCICATILRAKRGVPVWRGIRRCLSIYSKDSTWEECIYYLEAFRPPKLLAVTREKDGKEVASINNRSQIGNPCYLTKRHCDAALKASGL